MNAAAAIRPAGGVRGWQRRRRLKNHSARLCGNRSGGGGLVHVLSSDAHTVLGGRPVRISPALEKLREVEILAQHLEWIAETAPRAIVSGKPLELPYKPQL